jgi:hypothetical protein
MRFVRRDGSVAVDDSSAPAFRLWRQTWGTWRYDIVRYRYVWRAAGHVVRAVTAAGLADILPRTVLGATCTVTPSDGRLAAPATLAAG